MSRPDGVDEGLIHAWLDGELTGEEAARVERLAATDPAWSAAVAEARGFIAASSRIVRALDAVPGGVVPADSKAAPARARRVRPWMRMAAGMLLVAGTAYTLRETMSPAVDVDADMTPAPVEEVERSVPLPAPQPAAPRSANERSGAGAAADAAPQTALPSVREDAAPQSPPPPDPASAIVPSAPAPLPTRTAEALETAKTTELATTVQRARAERAPSAAPLRAAADATRDFAAAGAAAAGPLRALEDCWRVTAPDSLAALYRDLTVLRQSGDTLVLVLPNANTVTVVRRDDTLTGALTAIRVSCPLGSSTTPRDSK